MGNFLNEFLLNSDLFAAVIVFVAVALPVFGHFYNQFIDGLKSRTEHTSLYVVGGVFVTIVAGALFSWKSALMFLVLFGLSGLPMIVGEFKRTDHRVRLARVTKNKRKRLPYVANALIEEAFDDVKEAQRLIDVAFKNNGMNVPSALAMADASQKLSKAVSSLVELKGIQAEE